MAAEVNIVPHPAADKTVAIRRVVLAGTQTPGRKGAGHPRIDNGRLHEAVVADGHEAPGRFVEGSELTGLDVEVGQHGGVHVHGHHEVVPGQEHPEAPSLLHDGRDVRCPEAHAGVHP